MYDMESNIDSKKNQNEVLLHTETILKTTCFFDSFLILFLNQHDILHYCTRFDGLKARMSFMLTLDESNTVFPPYNK